MTCCKRSSTVLIEPYGVISGFIRVESGAVCSHWTWTVRPFDTKSVRTHDQWEMSRGV